MEPRIQILRELIENQIEVVAAAICEGNGALEAELRLEWLTRELAIEESGQRVFIDQSIAERRWGCSRPLACLGPFTLKQPRSN
ncbi:hypothetical protein [Bradyrhizobium sp. ERR14]|uniref:hypothetical protein n=1 Tax=Bradyrhizobium sp. ERR14 TaxID=2663837 RepID=UPI001612C607|nr:hypothetical protein [Bradyrhizobium sp. ERR14]MBB4399043.1 hypothetical protein [Bradyrhizobium sp. ERR14]